VYRPSGFVEGPVEALKDSTVFCRFDATVRRIEASSKDIDKQLAKGGAEGASVEES
jgi:hypothetical protein